MHGSPNCHISTVRPRLSQELFRDSVAQWHSDPYAGRSDYVERHQGATTRGVKVRAVGVVLAHALGVVSQRHRALIARSVTEITGLLAVSLKAVDSTGQQAADNHGACSALRLQSLQPYYAGSVTAPTKALVRRRRGLSAWRRRSPSASTWLGLVRKQCRTMCRQSWRMLNYYSVDQLSFPLLEPWFVKGWSKRNF